MTGAVASGHPDATRIGLEVLESGGSAADAAVAAAFALFTLMPEACGLGGDAFALVATPGETRAYNGSGDAPAEWLDSPRATGAATATVPGAVAALSDMHARHGRRDWEHLLAPSIELAVEGMTVSPTLRRALEQRSDVLDVTATEWPVRRAAESAGTVAQPELATVLTSIATEGPAVFYDGWIAEELVASARFGGAALAREDLARHTTHVREAVSVALGEWTIEVQPPVSQAVLIPFALNALRHAEEAGRSSDGDVPREHLLAEALEEGFIWRPLLHDPSAVKRLPWGWTPPAQSARRLLGARGTAHTTSVCTADSAGMVVTLLVSVFHEFGSGYLVPRLGLFLNDRMLGFRDTHNPRAARPVHTLSPALARTSTSCVGLATPGADAQVQVLTQVMDAAIHGDLDWRSALSLPRWRLDNQRLLVEEDTSPAVAERLRAWGHDVRPVPIRDHAMGAVTIAGWTRPTPQSELSCFSFADGRRGNSASQIPQ